MGEFRFLKQFNDPDKARGVDRRRRVGPIDATAFPGDSPIQRFARALCQHRTTPFREIVEAFEFFAIARKHARAEVVADLCGGHGLVAVLFAMFEHRVQRALVLDRTRPPSFDRVMAAAIESAPWTEGRVEFIETRLGNAPARIPATAGLVAVHACGHKTDHVLDLAIANRAPVAVMPCCHPVAESPAPAAVKRELGSVAVDVDRTYRLEAAGFHVRWSSVSAQITRESRVLLAHPRPS